MTPRRVVSAADVARWADVADDHNPLHLDPEFAAASRFGHPIVHGSLLFALLCDALQAAGGPWADSGALRVRFRLPVPVGQEVEFEVSPSGARLRCAGQDTAEVTVQRAQEAP